MTVTYTTDDGWQLVGTHLHLADEIDGVPASRKGNPIPGRFERSEPHGSTDTYSYTFPIPCSDDGEWIVAAHAVVEKIDTSRVLEAAGFSPQSTDEVNQGMRKDGSDVLAERRDRANARWSRTRRPPRPSSRWA